MKIVSYFSQILPVLKSQTAKSVSLILSSSIVNSALGFFISIIILRNLPSSDIGILYPLVSLLLMTNQFGDLGLSIGFVKLFSIFKTQDLKNEGHQTDHLISTFIWLKFVLALLVCLIGIFFSSQISDLLFDSASYESWVQITFVVAFFQFFTGLFQALAQADQRFKHLAISRTLPQIIKFSGIAIFLLLKKLNFTWTYIFFFQLPLFALFIILIGPNTKRALKSLRYGIEKEKVTRLYSIGKWICLSMVTNAAIAHSDILMTRSLVGDDELARLLGGQRLASVLPLISTSLVTVLLPKVNSMQGPKELNFFIRKSIRIMPLITGAFLLAIPLAPYFIPLLLGQKYESSVEVFNAFLIVQAIGVFITPLSLVFYRLDKEYIMSGINLFQMIINLVGNYIFIPIYGALAAAGTTLVCKLVAGIVVFWVLKKEGLLFVNFDSMSEE